jgi:DNA (cytosine-5)-methyltransferase 1
MKNQEKIVAVDLFCGVGGLTHGLERAGIDVRLGIDKDASCAYPFEANNRARFLEADVMEVTATEIRNSFGDAKITLLAGCAPCQPFSTYSRKAKRDHDGKRLGRGHPDDWTLVRRFGELVVEVQPDLVTMENVPPLADQDVFRDFLESLSSSYNIDYGVVEGQTIGLPQTRKRLVLVASRLGPISIPKFNRPQITVRQTILDMPPISAGETHPSDSLHRSSKLSALNLKRIRASRPGGTWRDWPEGLRSQCHQRLTGATYPSVYGRMSWDAPAPTITTQAFGFGNGRFGHPEQDRAISLREAAMLQGFPRKYSFVRDDDRVSFATLGRLIGNAVPVPLGEAIGTMLHDHIRQAYQS